MTTPSTAYPFSPSPSSPELFSDAPSSPDPSRPNEERRRSKRESTASATRRREEAATRYPSPPLGNDASASRRATSIDASLVIPPFNPNNRRPAVAAPAASSVNSSGTSSRRNSQAQELAPSMPTAASTYAFHPGQQRPMSVAVPVLSPVSPMIGGVPSSGSSSSSGTPQPSSSSRVRQSVGYLPSGANNSASSLGPYPQLYTPHPMPRQKIYFGPYILLQTLGEGEFGKVKLGVHSERWGEDVAIKLIKRGNVDTAQRGEKVRREIEVLKAVRHPNIVRLYDVIETDKYIGIVLEYASGGELFDHILAHRYLKERDASRLFAQLISGVGYLHAKGIVHRDLKLENLLLDRNRNVQITDFGFANRFESPEEDLMATSCGSPCYAAPELVVQEGKYVGTAVDVWSCGVILYAMLAGYLPYDDDPANPEGDNINLLYKYIINTPLSFPEWISAEPRELLLLMLVADPIKRCTIEDVMRHSWLRKFAPHFERTVEQLEKQAQEQELWKRQALEAQRQFLVQQYAQQQAQAQVQAQQQPIKGLGILGGGGPGPQGMTRSYTATGPPSSGTRLKTALAQSASQQTGLDTHAFTSSVKEEEVPSPSSTPREPRTSIVLPFPPAANRRSGNASFGSTSPTTTQTQRITVDADPFSFEPRSGKPSPSPSPKATSPTSVAMSPSYSAPPDPPSAPQQDDLMVVDGPRTARHASSTSSRSSRRSSTTTTAAGAKAATTTAATMTNVSAEAQQRRKAQHRATVQVEYDSEAAARGAARRKEAPLPAVVSIPAVEAVLAEDVVMTSTPEEVVIEAPSTPMSPDASIVAPPDGQATPTRSTTPPLVPLPASATPSTPTIESTSTASTPKKRKSSVEANEQDAKDLPPLPPVPAMTTATTALPSAPTTPTRSRMADKDSTPRAKKTSAPTPVTQRPASVTSSLASRTRTGTERFSLRSFLTGSSPDSTPRKEGSSGSEAQSQAALDEVTNAARRKSRRQKAMSLQPFRAGSNKSSKGPFTATQEEMLPPALPSSASTTRIGGKLGSMGPPAVPSSVNKPTTRASVAAGPPARDLEAAWLAGGSSTNGPPSGKAKAVMDWFRRRSVRAPGPSESSSNGLLGAPNSDARPASTRRQRPMSMMTPSASSRASVATTIVSPAATPSIEQAPSVVVTAIPVGGNQQSSPQSSRSASGGAQSQFSGKTASTLATTVSSSTSNSTVMAPIVSLTPTVSPPTFVAARLRVHQGALDKHALTYRSPPEVMVDIRHALWKMGVDMVVETEFKLKCVRKSRKKSQQQQLAGFGLGSTSASEGLGGSASLANAFEAETLSSTSRMTSSPSLASNLTASPSMTFRGFFARKNSSTPLGTPAIGTSPALTSSSVASSMHNMSSSSPDPLMSPAMTPSLSAGAGAILQQELQPQPVYGERSTDQGDEVRFHVEITRVKHLERLYCVDLKRVKGGPWSYKHVYDQLLGALELGPS